MAKTEVIYCKAIVKTQFSDPHQCKKGATKDGYCKHHHPEEYAKRAKAKQDKIDFDFQRHLIEKGGLLMHAALTLILEGHDNPQALARVTLEEISPTGNILDIKT